MTDAEIRPDDPRWTVHNEQTVGARLGEFPIAGLVRRARRLADLVQVWIDGLRTAGHAHHRGTRPQHLPEDGRQPTRLGSRSERLDVSDE